MVAAVRDARHEEAGEIADLLSRAAFGPTVSRLVAFPRTSPHGDVLVADNGDGEAAGAVCCVSFGATGWIGALGVAPEARRHGVGRALTEAAIARLHERGADTVLLFATDMGRPLYERLGFVIEGAATAWRGTAGAIPDRRAGAPPARRRPRGRHATLDRAATGEERGNLLEALHPLAGVAADRSGELVGWAAKAPYGAGIAICARDDEAGVALMAAAASGPAPATLVVPDANAAAMANLRRWGFRAANAGERMRLGPPGGLAAGAPVRAVQPLLGVERAGASVPQPDPRPQGLGRGHLRVPRRAGNSPAHGDRRTFRYPVLAAARPERRDGAVLEVARDQRRVDRLEQALAHDVVDVGKGGGAEVGHGGVDVVLGPARVGLAVAHQQPERRRLALVGHPHAPGVDHAAGARAQVELVMGVAAHHQRLLHRVEHGRQPRLGRHAR